MYTFLLVLQALVAAALIGVILMQKSEGGGLGVGGSPAGFLSARGAADFLTRATAILATVFVMLSIALAVLASVSHGANRIDADAANKINVPPVSAPEVPVQAPATGAPLDSGTGAPLLIDPAVAPPAGAPAPAQQQGVPLQQ